MTGYQSSNINAFLSVLFFMVAWWMAPETHERHDGNVIATFFFAACGLGFAMGAATTAVGHRSPFPSRLGRILWFIRPRAWMVAWAMIFVSIWVFGKPAVLFEYPLNGTGRCVYLTWDGLKFAHTSGAGRRGGCAIISFLH